MSTSRDHTPKEAGRDRKLESSLSNIKLFGSPKWELEQYPIGANLASCLLFMAESKYGDIAGKIVADLGCGVGTLGIAACLYDAA
jgi:predicted RNA methylase